MSDQARPGACDVPTAIDRLSRAVQHLEAALALTDDYGRLDLGCALVHGSFEATYDEDGTLHLTRCEAETALSFFCLRLFARLRQLGSVVPLHVDDWSRSL